MEYNKNNILRILIIASIVVFVVNIDEIIASQKDVKQKEDAVLKTNRPANISISIIKDSSCTDCADIAPVLNAVKSTNVKIIKEETFEAGSAEAKDIISKSGIQKLPTFIITGELNKNADVAKLLSQIGVIKNDVFAFNYFIAPYLDLASNSVKGKVTVTFINDKICTECYDVSLFKQILATNLGMTNPSTVSLDKSDKGAQDLISKYKIQSVPTFVLTGEVSAYPNLTGIWLQIGGLEKDGSYVLRDIKKVNPILVYRDLATGQIIKPEAPQTPVVSPTSTPISK